MTGNKPTNINDYISNFPTVIQELLKTMRATIKKAVPKATETISYGMPAFTLNGTSVWFAAYKNHIGLYPMYGMDEFEGEMMQYKGKRTKDTLQFPYHQPLPLELITKIVRHKFQVPNAQTSLIVLKPREGRSYNCGKMTAVFKADENETANKYSISEWWIAPHFEGVGAHQHDENDEVFYGIKGNVSVLVGDKWRDIEPGAFIRIPAKTIHDFANRTNDEVGLLNFFIPGGFEKDMPSIVKWFENNK